MEAKVTWVEGKSFDAVADSGHVVRVGTSKENGGADDGPSPMEMILMSLVGCTAFDVISIMKKKRQEVTSFEIKVNGDRVDEHPRIYEKLFVEYVIGGVDIDPAAVEHAVSLSVDKYCSVLAMVKDTVPVEHKITIL